jgi:hypothetical protein
MNAIDNIRAAWNEATPNSFNRVGKSCGQKHAAA